MSLLKRSLVFLAAMRALTSSAQLVTTTTNFSVNAEVPDGSLSGLVSAKTVSTPVAHITGLKVSLKISGQFIGDLYCYLSHSSGRTVLLNRVGRRSGSNLGYNDAGGLDVTFDDAASNGDIHDYRFMLNGNESNSIPATITNAWAPDARTASPLMAMDTDSRSAFLGSFNGVNPNGEWVLFIADVEGGDVSTLESWGLEISGDTAPVIVSQPAHQSVECSSGTASFSVSAQGGAPLVYGRRFNGNPLPGATAANLTITNATSANAGQYDVVVTNSYGAVTSSIANLTIIDSTLPAVTILGPNPMTNECHAAFIDPGAVASDSCAGILAVVTNSTVNPNAVSSYTISYQATDPAGNSTMASRTVYVVDTTPPSINCSPNLTVVTTNGSGTGVSFSNSANDLCSGSVPVSSTPSSGSVFPIGTTTVNCSAMDPSGNSNFCSFIVTVVLNHPPMVTNVTFNAVQNHQRIMTVEQLLAKSGDPDNEALSISAVSATSTNGGAVTLTATQAIYTPVNNFIGADLFTFTVSDGRGGTTVGSAILQVTSQSDPSFNRITSLRISGGVRVRFTGVPGATYTMQRSSNLLSWASIGSFTLPDSGSIEFIDSAPPPGKNFYRAVSQ